MKNLRKLLISVMDYNPSVSFKIPQNYFQINFFSKAIYETNLKKYIEMKSNNPLLFLFNCWVVSDSLQPHGLQHARLPCFHYLLEFVQTHVHWVNDIIHLSHPLKPPSPPALDLSLNSLTDFVLFLLLMFKHIKNRLIQLSFELSIFPRLFK